MVGTGTGIGSQHEQGSASIEVGWGPHLSAMLPFMANEMAFMNSVVFGTSAKSVTPRNFSGMPEPSSTTSTTSTKISAFVKDRQGERQQEAHQCDRGRRLLTGNDGIKRRAPEQHAVALCPAPIGRVVPSMTPAVIAAGVKLPFARLALVLPDVRGLAPELSATGRRHVVRVLCSRSHDLNSPSVLFLGDAGREGGRFGRAELGLRLNLLRQAIHTARG